MGNLIKNKEIKISIILLTLFLLIYTVRWNILFFVLDSTISLRTMYVDCGEENLNDVKGIKCMDQIQSFDNTSVTDKCNNLVKISEPWNGPEYFVDIKIRKIVSICRKAPYAKKNCVPLDWNC